MPRIRNYEEDEDYSVRDEEYLIKSKDRRKHSIKDIRQYTNATKPYSEQDDQNNEKETSGSEDVK